MHATALTLGVVGIVAALFVGGYWAIALGATGAVMASISARAGTSGAGRAHVPALAVCLLVVILGVGAVVTGMMVKGR
jgi:hypothetical protein